MSLTVAILIIVPQDDIELSQEELIPVRHSIQDIGGELTSILYSACDKIVIKKKIISLCNNEDNIIVVMGNTTIFPTLNDIAYETIKNVSNVDIPNSKELLSKLTECLKHSFDRPICGIRNRTLIINMCGSFANAMISLKGNGSRLFDIIHSINITQDEEMCDTKNDNNSDEEFYDDDNNNNNDDDDSKSDEASISLVFEEKCEDTNESHETMYEEQSTTAKSVNDAINVMHNAVSMYKVLTEKVDVSNAYGRILSDHLFSSTNVPFCNVAAKRGYAVLDSDKEKVRKVMKACPEFAESLVKSGTCMRVRSGEPIPTEATAVVTLENTKIIEKSKDNIDYFNVDDMEYEIEILTAPKKNENIRTVGCEVQCDQRILEKYSRIGTAELAILTLCGFEQIPVIRLPFIGLLSVGNELEQPGNKLTLGRIYDSNRITVASLLNENGFNSIDFGISAYQKNAIIDKIENALDKVDVLVIMGRANDGDILKPILSEHFKAIIHFGRVDMKPGKSTTFATCMHRNDRIKFFLCMSANPATVFVVAHVVLLPLLHDMHQNLKKPLVMQTRTTGKHRLHPRPKFSWTTLQWTETETFPKTNCSINQSRYTMKYPKANALLMLPPRTFEVPVLGEAFVPAMFLG